jgi:YhcH/YjgK/YiaL family protein
MILDHIEHAAMYRALGPRIAAALDYLRQTDFSKMADGRHELDGDRLIAILQHYRTRPHSEIIWEAHRRYVDVQYIVAGTEQMGYAGLRPDLPVKQAYDETKDFAFYDAQGALFEVKSGNFAIFAPQDVHAPGLAAGSPPTPAEMFKVVMKCRVD